MFVFAYVANGCNAAAAYRSAHPGVTEQTARVEGHRTLANPNVRAYLDEQLEPRRKALEITADEVLALLSMAARADMRLLFDHRGHVLPPTEWPYDIAMSVQSLKMRRSQIVGIHLTPKIPALRTLLEVHGLIGRHNRRRAQVDVLAEILREPPQLTGEGSRDRSVAVAR
jgi:phage terminase small subunit